MIKKILDFYKRLSKRERVVFYGTFLVIAILGSDRLILGPVGHKMKLLDQQIRDQEAAVKKSLLVLMRKDRIATQGKEFMAYSIESQNPEQEMGSLLKELEGIADHSGVSLLYVKPAKEAGEGTVKKYFASLECESEMEQIATFFHEIESSTKLLKIEKYDIQPKNKESSLAHAVVTVSKTVFSG